MKKMDKRTPVVAILESDSTLSQKDISFIRAYKYEGKTAEEWEVECDQAKGYNEDGDPEWYGLLSKMMDTVVLARLILKGNNK